MNAPNKCLVRHHIGYYIVVFNNPEATSTFYLVNGAGVARKSIAIHSHLFYP
jgi:hypothetical protein